MRTVWFWFTAPPPPAGRVTSSVGLAARAHAEYWPVGTLLQVLKVREPVAGLCSDARTRCNIGAQDCPSGVGPCVLDEARACQGLAPIACSDAVLWSPSDPCCTTGAADLCVGELIPGHRYYIVLAVLEEPGTEVYEILGHTPCYGPVALVDCNNNDLPDQCDLVGGAPDQNGNYVPDECELLGDCTWDDVVDLNDAERLVGCITGPFGGEFIGWPPYECGCVNLNGDRAIDLRDVSSFITRFGNIR